MFDVFARHAEPAAMLMYRGDPLYHASLNPDEYAALLGSIGFEVFICVVEDTGRRAAAARRGSREPGRRSLLGLSLVYHAGSPGSSSDVVYTVENQLSQTATGTLDVVAQTPPSKPATIIGPPGGHATIRGPSGPASILTQGSGNTVYANGGNDTVFTTAGGNTIYVNTGNVTVDLLGSMNIVQGFPGSGATASAGADGNDSVSGNSGTDRITLGNGNDTVQLMLGGNTIALGNGNDTISINAGGNTISVGNGHDSISVAGTRNAITLGSGTDVVHGGSLDTITLGSTGGTLSLSGVGEVVFLGTGKASVTDLGHGTTFVAGPSVGIDTIVSFDTNGVLDLVGGAGGFTTATQAFKALTSDQHGGSLLSLGGGHSIDFAGVPPNHLSASNFKIG